MHVGTVSELQSHIWAIMKLYSVNIFTMCNNANEICDKLSFLGPILFNSLGCKHHFSCLQVVVSL